MNGVSTISRQGGRRFHVMGMSGLAIRSLIVIGTSTSATRFFRRFIQRATGGRSEEDL